MYNFSSAARVCNGNYIKINRRKGHGDETTIEDIHGRYYCSCEGDWWCKKCAEEIRWIDNLDKNEIQIEKSRSRTIVKRKMKEVNFRIAGDRIPTVKENSVESLGRWYENGLSDRPKGIQIFKQTGNMLKAIDKTSLYGKFKVRCLQYSLYPRLQWPLMVYEVGAFRVERVEQKCSAYIRTWLKLR